MPIGRLIQKIARQPIVWSPRKATSQPSPGATLQRSEPLPLSLGGSAPGQVAWWAPIIMAARSSGARNDAGGGGPHE
jgi:hypothetical protein